MTEDETPTNLVRQRDNVFTARIIHLSSSHTSLADIDREISAQTWTCPTLYP